MIIKNAKVFSESGSFEEKNVIIDGQYFSDSTMDTEEFDADGCYVIPGLVDIHFHGCVGHDFCDGTEESIQAIADYELSCGVTTIIPASMTLSEDTLKTVFQAAADHKNEKGAELVGINMEGPFVSAAKKGAQNGEFIHKPDAEMFHRLNAVSGHKIKHVALAPEEPGAMEFIEQVKNDTVISIAHTTADYDTAKKAIEAGATHVTHLYNAMPPFTHRAPGVIGAAADHDNVFVELICDGIHIHPSTVRTTFKIFGADRICLISDSMEATGMPDGEYALGGQKVIKKGNLATLVDGTIAGSATNLMDCMRTAITKMDIPMESAIKAATATPARSIGIYDQYGSISTGKYANCVVLDKDLNIKAIFLKGKQI
ncbi:MAG: N-acetylglucosamine-6-phosphate deacetylase [Clostridiales bacterium]|nr:N-acetylglucosamine-6-phosphate deacetylase [Clostridiales bacterium]